MGERETSARDPYDTTSWARALIRRNFANVTFKDEPGGMKRGGWADTFADDLAALLRRQPKQRLLEACDGVGKWLSAALDDPKVCDEMKADINAFFSALEASRPPQLQTQSEQERG